MKLWLLRPIDGVSEPWAPWYYKVFGFVIRALTESDARSMAAADAGVHADPRDSWWLVERMGKYPPEYLYMDADPTDGTPTLTTDALRARQYENKSSAVKAANTIRALHKLPMKAVSHGFAPMPQKCEQCEPTSPKCEGCGEPATTTDIEGINLCSLCAAESAAGGNP